MRRSMMAWATAGLLAVTPGSASAQQPLGDFYFFDRSDPATGEDRSSVTTLAEESYVSGAGGLTVQCAEDGRELVLTASYLGRDTSTQVGYGFGEEEPVETAWRLRSTGMAAIAPREVMEGFLARAVQEPTAVFVVSDFQARRHTYTFSLGSLEAALGRLSCR